MARDKAIISRRKMLKSSGVAGAIALAGCQEQENGNGGVAGTPSGDEVVVGILAPMSGFFADSGPHIRSGCEYAAEVFRNEGGEIDGRDIRTELRDTGTDPSTAVTATRQLIEQEGMDILTGTFSSAVGLALIELVEKEEIVFNSSIGSQSITRGDCSPYVFTHIPSPTMLVRAGPLTYLAEEEGIESVYSIIVDYEWGQSMYQANLEVMEEEHGVEIIGNSFVEPTATDLSGPISRAMDSGADVIHGTVSTPSLNTRLFSQLNEFGARNEVDFITAGWTGQLVYNAMESIEDIYSVVPYWWQTEGGQNEEFVEAYSARFGSVPFYEAAQTYDSTLEILRVAEEAGTTEGLELAKALEGHEWESFRGGQASFRECDHQNTFDMFTVRGKAEEDMENENDFVDILRQNPDDKIVHDCHPDCTANPVND